MCSFTFVTLSNATFSAGPRQRGFPTVRLGGFQLGLLQSHRQTKDQPCQYFGSYKAKAPSTHTMDHLPQLTGQSSRVAKAPFYSRYNYDSVGIQGFPERCGYQLGSPYHHRDADSAFFQAWLYFGTLIEVLGTYDITVEVSDFCKQENDGVLSLCTSSLQDYIAAWVVKASREDRSILEKDGYTSAASALGSDIARTAGTATGRMIVRLMGKCPAPKQTQPLASREQIKATTQNRASRIHEIFREVATMLHDLAPRASSVRESVWDSTLVLCSSLQTAAHFIYRSQNLPFKFSKLFDNIPARQLGSLFDRNGWCVRERKIIRDMAEGDNCVLFLSAQLSRWADVSHNKCNIQMCKAYQVENESIYETKHVVDACKCDMIGFGRSQGGFLSAISTAIIQPSNTPLNLSSSPMIKYKDGNIQLVEMTLLGGDAKRVKLPFGQAFAAVSHVWAHGLGNPHSNDAPRCQVERIQVSILRSPLRSSDATPRCLSRRELWTSFTNQIHCRTVRSPSLLTAFVMFQLEHLFEADMLSISLQTGPPNS